MARKGDRDGKSQAQERLAGEIAEWFPFARVRQEVYIGELIESHGFTMDEVAEELGRRPHRMFCDIHVSDSDGDFVVEYHGEQHYHVIEGMTTTERALSLNQHLDREKSWILDRIGVPLVAVPYDAYVDESVLSRMLDEATAELAESQARLYVCDGCGRRFPQGRLAGGMCPACQERERERVEEEFRRAQERRMAVSEEDLPADEEAWEPADEEPEEASGSSNWEERRKEEQKAKARARRKEAYRQWKESPEYQRRKEEQKAARRKAYQERKEWMREQRKRRDD